MGKVRISVVLPCFGREKLALEALASIATQSQLPYEVIVVDDASPQALNQAQFDSVYPEMRFYRLPKNLGVASARNFAVSRARGEWIAFLDSDDLWYPEKIETITKNIVESPSFNIWHSGEHWEKNFRPKKVIEDDLVRQGRNGHKLYRKVLRFT